MKRQIVIDRGNPALWIATFDHPPINLIDPDTIEELQALVAELETHPEVKVIVFRSADPEYFLAHWDVLTEKTRTAAMQPGPTGMHPWLDVMVRLSRAPVVSIAEIRGYARGAGSEFALACDMRFASLEKAVLGQFEVGVGAVPGGNPGARLAGMVGRGRALEIILGADDYSATLAADYGYVNRVLQDSEITAYVDALARRIASFEKYAIAGAKRHLDVVSLPDDGLFPPAMTDFFKTASEPATRARVGALVKRGLQTRSEIERNLGKAVAE
jgi:enoyl-CoA hydratase/carnithine racemase